MTRNGRVAARTIAGIAALLTLSRSELASQGSTASAPSPTATTFHYQAEFRRPPAIEALQRHLVPGDDAFPEEKIVEALTAQLGTLSAALRGRPAGAADAAGVLLAPQFKGGRLAGAELPAGSQPLAIARATASPGATLDRAAFHKELTTLTGAFAAIDVAEFLITRVEAVPGGVQTTVRFDIAGAATDGGRAESIGHWQVRWQQEGSRWSIAEWTAADAVRSRTTGPIFREATDAAFGTIPAFAAQLRPDLDDWITRLDGAFMPGGMGHHGVSAGDADGDGLDDLYVSQPSGLPNRLFRNNGDGTFADITEAAGLAVLDSTSQSLFIDIDNDADQDLVLVARSGPLLFTNNGKAHFTYEPKAFQLAQPLRGTLTSAAAADYDRDGFIDLYLCAYSFLIGASEDKAGPPAPYHDAQNGPPNVLLHNDGHGRFVEVTEAAGLNEQNDRFSFAATWGDFDEDGWPDLLVANDFGRKNLYRNLGLVDGQVRFKDVTESAGVADYGAGMSAAFVDYDNDGHLDIYTGNMWTAAGLRVTSLPGFMPQAPPDIRALYQRHARGNSLFRNRGDGTFEDVTLKARAEFGRWAWSSDALDFDNDSFDDLLVVNGMFTRAADESDVNIDSFFWRQVTARSPLERQVGTAYDDAWRATNRLLMRHGSQASHERNVLLRNDGRGSFDDISGVTGLDLDQDGRSFAVFDYDNDGDADIVLASPRASPELRLFRNEFAAGNRSLAVRLVGTKSNRDAIGARVTVVTDQGSFTRVVKAGSGFISQHSKTLLFGLGASTRVAKISIVWPSGHAQSLPETGVNQRILVTENSDEVRGEPFVTAQAPSRSPAAAPAKSATLSGATWLYQGYPAPDFALRDVSGQEQSLAAHAGHPLALLFWATWAPPSRALLDELGRQKRALTAAGAQALAVSVDAQDKAADVQALSKAVGLPIAIADKEIAGTYSLLHRYLFDRREDLRLPTLFLINGRGEIVRVYHEPAAVADIAEDVATIGVPEAERLARSLPFKGTFYAAPGERNYFQYGLELSEQGYDAAALVAFERVAKVDPSAITFYNLGTLYLRRGRTADARAAFERALQLQKDYADANNSLGALLAQGGDLPAAIERFRAALTAKPQFADAMNNLGFALFQTGDATQARELYEKALALQPEFPEALNNLGIFYGSQRDLVRALTYFEQAVSQRAGYGEAANNLALVLAARGETVKAIDVLQRLLQLNPGFEMAYVTLCRIYLKSGQRQEGTQVLERLLQRNPTHPVGLQLLQGIRSGG
jgi:Tfp pilus assembly protein PilF/peroxiredoxin